MPKSPAFQVPYSCAMIGLLVACPAWAFLTVRLGGADEASEHRYWYLRFRERIVSGDVSGFYSQVIARVLTRIDKFFGDGGPPPRRNWTHALFGLRTAAPLWTAPAYDRCLTLALIYPITVIFFVWGWSGHVGVAESALGLPPETGFVRALKLFGMVAMIISFWLVQRLSGRKSIVAFAFAFAFAVAVAGGGAVAGAGAGAGAFAVAVAVVGAFAVAVAGAFAGAGAVIVVVVVVILNISKNKQRFGIGLFLFSVLMLIAIFSVSQWISGTPLATKSLVLLYFLPLLTLVNAPFDWLSLGITRGLLRRGLERGGIEPLLLGLLDVIISIIVMALLAVAVLWATEFFNHAIISGGGKPIIDPTRLLALLANPATRGDYEHWWLYAMLFSTQLPAIANITFGTFCLSRGLPTVNRWIAALLPENGRIGLWQRVGVATATAIQLGVAVMLGLLALYYLYFWGLVALVDASFGVTLIELLGSVSLGLG